MKKCLLIGFLTGIMVLSGCGDPNFPVERVNSDLSPIPYCEENGGFVDHWEEEGIDTYFCLFEDDSYCSLEDFANGDCKKGDNYDHDIMPYVEAACEYSVGTVSEDEKGEKICIFSDNGICYLNDILEGKCESDLLWNETQGRLDLYKGQFYCKESGGEVDVFDELCMFDDMSACDLVEYYYGRCDKGDEQYQEINALTWARNKCVERNGQLSEDNKGRELCIINDNCYYETDGPSLFIALECDENSVVTKTHKRSSDGSGWEGVSKGVIRDSEGNFESYKREGERTFYNYSGGVVLNGTYSGGKMDGEWFYYQGGTVQANEIYENGKLREVISCDVCGGNIYKYGAIRIIVDALSMSQ